MRVIQSSSGSQEALRKGDVVLLKVSGAELEGKGLNGMLKYISFLQRERLRTVLVYGGGMQIDRLHYKYYQGERKRPQGIVPIDDITLDAYSSIQKHLKIWFPPIQFADSLSIRVCGESINVLDASLCHETGSVTAFGFIGTNGIQNYNLNADSVASALIRQFQEIRRAIFCTEVGGVHEKHQRRVPKLYTRHIRSDGSHKFIDISDGMRPKLLAIRDCGISEVLITSASKLYETLNVRSLHRRSEGTIVCSSTIGK
ncbi:hypothetical protein GX553_00725 [Candidatus Peribacteria bacterium]|nr:hypothetical protein [Candidatus Peribacteria bacterium]